VSAILVVLVFTAGCSGILDDNDTTRELKLVNQDNADHAVVVEISDKTGLVYSDGRTIGAESDFNLKQFNQTGEFDVKVTVDGDSTTETHTFQPTDHPVHTTTIGIANDGTVTIEESDT
jgi:hypothetical protein